MSTVNQIAAALGELLSHVPGVDAYSLDVYLPPVTTASIGLVIPPFGMETRVEGVGARQSGLIQSHRIRCEFWIKIDAGRLAYTLERAREVGLDASRLLIRNQTLSEKVSRVGHYGKDGQGPRIDVEVTPAPTQVGNATYIIVTVIVGVVDYADAE